MPFTKSPVASAASAGQSEANYALSELCVLADLPVRTARYYIQIGLVDRPEGETRAARYGTAHLEQLLLIKKWTAAGVSLERIRELLRGEPEPVPARKRAIGSVAVHSHLQVAEGVEVVIEPGAAGLSPEQVRQFIRGVMAVYEQVVGVADSSQPAGPADPGAPVTPHQNQGERS